ncbi:MAG: penicillin-binding transpeptidase domain-containing protein [Acidobacteriota bacterium]|nr:penicillin-binding transpeptidase domain-containing protein [Acidobacteriota bacterium]
MHRSFSLLSLVCAVFMALGLLTTETNAQKSKSSPKTATKTADKRSDAKSDKKSAKNNKETADAKNRKDSKDKKQADARSKNKKDEREARGKSDDKKSKDKKRDDRTADKKSDKKDKKSDDKKSDDRRADKKSEDKRGSKKESVAERRERERKEAEARREAERREAERRAAIEAERKRREQARLEAIARARAFEKGLRDETVANILKDDLTGEDMEIRRAAINALGERAGTVVVMDAQNGRVVSMVNQDWAARRGFKPCSTIKLVTGVAGINEKVINEFGEVTTASSRLDLTDALAYSNNTYFQKVGGSIGYNKMMSYSRELGLGEQTGINLAGESAGKLPEPKSGFALNRMSSHGDDFEVTPLQLAVSVSALTNGGKVLKPHVVKNQQEQISFRPIMRRQLNLPQTTLRGVMPGMMGAVDYGTARRAKDDSLRIAGKTGSCIGQGSWVGLFASVAPIQNPKYAVVVVTRGQAERGKWASQVAGKIYQALAPRIRANSPPPQPMIATQQPVVVPPRPKVDPRTAARISAEEEGSDEEAQADAEGGDFTNGKSAGKSGKFDTRVPAANQTAAPTLPTVNGSNKVKTINKVYPRGNPPATQPAAKPANNTGNSPATQQPANSEQRRPRIVANPKP